MADPDFDPNFRVPILKIIIDGDPPEPDLSVMPRLNQRLRAMPKLPNNLKGLTPREFILQGSGAASGETEWLINGLQFEPTHQMARPKKGVSELWTIKNGGGGWVHPMRMHME